MVVEYEILQGFARQQHLDSDEELKKLAHLKPINQSY